MKKLKMVHHNATRKASPTSWFHLGTDRISNQTKFDHLSYQPDQESQLLILQKRI
jgi:hypothetical protein